MAVCLSPLGDLRIIRKQREITLPFRIVEQDELDLRLLLELDRTIRVRDRILYLVDIRRHEEPCTLHRIDKTNLCCGCALLLHRVHCLYEPRICDRSLCFFDFWQNTHLIINSYSDRRNACT